MKKTSGRKKRIGDYFTITGAAEYLGITNRDIRNMFEKGIIPGHVRMGSDMGTKRDKLLFHLNDLNKYKIDNIIDNSTMNEPVEDMEKRFTMLKRNKNIMPLG